MNDPNEFLLIEVIVRPEARVDGSYAPIDVNMTGSLEMDVQYLDGSRIEYQRLDDRILTTRGMKQRKFHVPHRDAGSLHWMRLFAMGDYTNIYPIDLTRRLIDSKISGEVAQRHEVKISEFTTLAFSVDASIPPGFQHELEGLHPFQVRERDLTIHERWYSCPQDGKEEEAETDGLYEYTLATVASVSYFPRIEAMAANWLLPAPISLALYLDHDPNNPASKQKEVILSMIRDGGSLPNIGKRVQIHLVEGKEGVPFPINALRNLAVDFAKSRYVTLIEADMVVPRLVQERLLQLGSNNAISALTAQVISAEEGNECPQGAILSKSTCRRAWILPLFRISLDKNVLEKTLAKAKNASATVDKEKLETILKLLESKGTTEISSQIPIPSTVEELTSDHSPWAPIGYESHSYFPDQVTPEMWKLGGVVGLERIPEPQEPYYIARKEDYVRYPSHVGSLGSLPHGKRLSFQDKVLANMQQKDRFQWRMFPLGYMLNINYDDYSSKNLVHGSFQFEDMDPYHRDWLLYNDVTTAAQFWSFDAVVAAGG